MSDTATILLKIDRLAVKLGVDAPALALWRHALLYIGAAAIAFGAWAAVFVVVMLIDGRDYSPDLARILDARTDHILLLTYLTWRVYKLLRADVAAEERGGVS